MKSIPLLVLFSLLIGCASVVPKRESTLPIGYATEENATLIATVSCQHELFPAPEPYRFYFKPDNEPNVGYLAGSMSSSLHGEERNVGTFSAGVSFSPILKNKVFGLEFAWYYFSSTKDYSDTFTIFTPIGKDTDGKRGRFKYKVVWTERTNGMK